MSSTPTLAAKVAVELGDMLLRTHPWRIHFFNETLDWSDVRTLIGFVLSGAPAVDGDYVRQFEIMMRDSIDPEGFACSFGAGRMALYAILEAMDIGPGDEVVIPAFTCEVVVHALRYRGCRPVYADIEASTFNLDVAKLATVLTPRCKAILAQHTFGVPCDLDGILAMARPRGIRVIEDCALAMGSTYNGRPIGSIGDAALFSMDRSKMLSTIAGGVAFTRDAALAGRLRKSHREAPSLSAAAAWNIGMQLLCSYALHSPYLYPVGRNLTVLGYKTGLFVDHRDDTVSFRRPRRYPCRYTNLQASVGVNQLRKLPGVLARRRAAVARYRQVLRDRGVQTTDAGFTLRFPLLLRDRGTFIRRWRRYFEVGTWFDSPAIGWTGDLSKISYQDGACPVAEWVHRHIVNFPTHQTSARMLDYLCEVLQTLGPGDVTTLPQSTPALSLT